MLLGIFVLGFAARSPIVFEAFAKNDDDFLMQLAGMPPQTDHMRAYADEQGWDVVCEGTSDGRTVLHFAPNIWLRLNDRGEHETHFMAEMAQVGLSGGTITRRRSKAQGCDRYSGWISPAEDMRDVPVGYGTREDLEPLLPIVRECGVKDARIREFTAEERESFGLMGVPEAMALAVEADGDLSGYHLTCAGAMTNFLLREPA